MSRPLTPEGLRRRRSRCRSRRRLRLVAVAAIVLAAAPVGIFVTRGRAEPQRTARPAAPPGAGVAKSPRTAPARAAAVKRGRLGSGQQVTLAFGGDVHFEGVVRSKLDSSPASVLAPVAPILRRADVAMVNLETAVTDGGDPAPDKEYHFRAPATAFDALEAGGVDVATMANNHGMDYGVSGLRDSLAAARQRRFSVVGIGLDGKAAYRPYRDLVNGQRVAIIGATQVLDDHLISSWTAGPRKPGLASAKTVDRLVEAVRHARATADTVVVYLHWGVELEGCPTADQRSLAQALVAAGADVVVGSHAHRLQGAGRLRGALVDYGLGNFAFYSDGGWGTHSGVLVVTVTGRRIDGYRWRPARISGGSPYPLNGSEKSLAVAGWRGLRACTGLRP